MPPFDYEVPEGHSQEENKRRFLMRIDDFLAAERAKNIFLKILQDTEQAAKNRLIYRKDDEHER